MAGPRDKRLWIGAAAVAVVVVYALLLAVVQRFTVSAGQPSSTYDPSPEGLSVYAEYLDELGYGAETWERFDELPEDATLIAVAPFYREPTRGESGRVAEWVREGGRLVIAGAGAEALVEGLDLGAGTVRAIREDVRPLFPSVYGRGIERVLPGEGRLLVSDPGWVAHYKDLSGQVLVSRAEGEGEVVWLAGEYALTNEGIGEADNARLAVALAAAAPGRDIYFDEYHHGYVSGGGLWDRLEGDGRTALALAVLAAAVWIVAAARRTAPPVRPLARPAARSGAYVGALAELYRRAGARTFAIETLEGGLVRSLAARYGDARPGLARHPAARDALDAAAAYRAEGTGSEDGFVATAAAIGRARREVEGRDG